MKTIGILTFEKYLGKRGIGSSRIRGEWLTKHWKDAEIFVQGRKYEICIYQKAYFVEHAKAFKGIKILDICDADFLHWGYRTKEMIEEVDAVVTSTESLAESLRAFTNVPVVCIPDRIDTDEILKHKYHKGDAKWVAWFGYSSNFEMLRPVINFLKRNNLNLIVISDSGFSIPTSIKGIKLRNLPHSWDTLYDDLLEADIVVNPQSSRGKWRYKSNNKTILAWSLGLPVAQTVDDLKKFISETERRKEQVLRFKEVEDKWKIEYSVNEYKKLIDTLKK